MRSLHQWERRVQNVRIRSLRPSEHLPPIGDGSDGEALSAKRRRQGSEPFEVAASEENPHAGLKRTEVQSSPPHWPIQRGFTSGAPGKHHINREVRLMWL